MIRAAQGNFLTDIFDLVYLRFALNAQRVHLCAELTATPWMLETFEDVGANFSLQVIAKNQCENYEKSSLC